jgi:hypothetical protein
LVKAASVCRPAFSLGAAEIADKQSKRLHLRSVFADYRKAANNDGFAARWDGERARVLFKCPPSAIMTKARACLDHDNVERKSYKV